MKIIEAFDSRYAIEVDEHNFIMVDVHEGKRTTPVYKERMFDCGFQRGLEPPDKPWPSIEELLAYPLYDCFKDPECAEFFKYHENLAEYRRKKHLERMAEYKKTHPPRSEKK